jgi:phage baseplate assembly protein W
MPIVNSIRRINPLDLNKNVKIGVAFPLDEENMFSGTQTVKDQIKANLINVLLTQPGERVNEPNFGVGLKHYIFEPNINKDSLNEIINNQINYYIPTISLIDTIVSTTDNEHKIFIKIIYSIKSNKHEVDAIQLNFNN